MDLAGVVSSSHRTLWAVVLVVGLYWLLISVTVTLIPCETVKEMTRAYNMFIISIDVI